MISVQYYECYCTLLRGPLFFGTHCSYSTLGPVSAWVGDRLWTGKPPRRRTRHPGLLSLSLPSVIRLEWVPGKSWGVNRHIAWYASLYPWSRNVRWYLAGGLACGDQHRCTGSGKTLEALCDDAYKYMFTILNFLLYSRWHWVSNLCGRPQLDILICTVFVIIAKSTVPQN